MWNEANHAGGYTARHPGAVARLYDAAVRECPSCRIVGADVLDSENMLPWVRAFQRAARHPVRIWGLHNYIDARRGSDRRTRALLAATRGQVWFTETGAWLVRRRYDEKRPRAAGVAPHAAPERAHHAPRVPARVPEPADPAGLPLQLARALDRHDLGLRVREPPRRAAARVPRAAPAGRGAGGPYVRCR